MPVHYLHNRSHYRTDDISCDFCDHSRPLLVNCTGVNVMDAPFSTHVAQGRRDYYLMYVLQGCLFAGAGEKSFPLCPGQAVLYAPNQGYRYRFDGGRLVYLWVHFTGSRAAQLLSSLDLALDTPYSPGPSEELQADFEALWRLFLIRPIYFLPEASAQLELLLTHLARRIRQPETDGPLSRLKESLHYLNRHYAEPIRLETLAGMAYLSPSRYSALFRQLMGVSPQNYLISLRLRYAQELLCSTDLSVSETARSVGYDDPLYFSRLYRRHFGLSPRQTRKKD